MLILTIVKNGTDQTTVYSAAGWTEIGQFHNDEGAGTGMLALFYKVATGSESGSFTPTRVGTAPTREAAVIERYSGVDISGTPYEGLQTSTVGNLVDTLVDVPAVTTTANGRLLINKFMRQTGNLFVAPEAGWTEAWEFVRDSAGADYQFATHYKDAVGFGVQDVENATSNSPGEFHAVSFALIGLEP
ncbi:MAG TPA: hypothetical protein VMN38_11730 [Sphingomicrobium sp.]|nr:hypothetical protein [Sphingomicrobium sp.]